MISFVDDFGELVYPPGSRNAGYLWARDAKLLKSYYPGVKGTWAVPVEYDAKREVAAFVENDANCNTCRHLIRIPHEKQHPARLHVGMCGHQPYKPLIQFHPDDCMGMRCWEGRR